ncbi:AAA domain-containing protein [Kribbella catacumbae]|uniref:AAA domain-containing protein n=1 Tax=Kribbella catacumbae TaxID=460086 RepID=UPI000378288C|nr:AAA domain-containing protein [Kribbella catacumbae]
MIDPRSQVVLVCDKSGKWEDKTSQITRLQTPAGQFAITYARSSRIYSYGPERVRTLGRIQQIVLRNGERVEVEGAVWEGATEVCMFAGYGDARARVFYTTRDGAKHALRMVPDVRVLANGADAPGAADVLAYWRAIVDESPGDDPLRPVYDSLRFVHPESALARYLVGAPIEVRGLESAPIYPFRCNLSQRQAVEYALTHSFSVIEGPPGTGKTETILNLIANIIATGAQTVGVVSFGNSAVDNVKEKLDELQFGHVVARLGNRDRVQAFFAGYETRTKPMQQDAPVQPSLEALAKLDARLRQLQEAERDRAQWRQDLDAYTLELQHFEKHVAPGDLSQLERLPLLRRSSDRILDYLAETEIEGGRSPGLIRRIRKYLRYGSLRGLDPEDTAVVLRLQRAFYEQRIAELKTQVDQVDSLLDRAAFESISAEHSQLSADVLRAALYARSKEAGSTRYTAANYRNSFAEFATKHPVLLSTCHSLRSNLPAGHLLDYLIIDEASQVSLLAAGAALASCRNLVVVGDRKQLQHIAAPTTQVAPQPAYDHVEESILTSLGVLYQDGLPNTLLREHYRCDPAIIGFCNKAFYDGDLIPFTQSTGSHSMVVRRTAQGNHMRKHTAGGRTNQREVEVIRDEVIPQECAGTPIDAIGVTTPYRRQVDKVADALAVGLETIAVDTVHKYQGRQKDVMIMSTVLDETWRGSTGLKFVDDPALVNVAVSRAVKKFVLVTNHDKLSKSRYLRDLIGYIDYQRLDEGVVDSGIVSVFDLLYREYSEKLRPLAARRRNELRYPSEDIIWTVLHELLGEEQYWHLTVSAQVLVRNLLADLSELTAEQAQYVRNRASVDFVVYNRISNRPLLAIEVDGFAFHEDNPRQRARDLLKDQIFQTSRMPLLRLPTTGSGEEQRLRDGIAKAEAFWGGQ